MKRSLILAMLVAAIAGCSNTAPIAVAPIVSAANSDTRQTRTLMKLRQQVVANDKLWFDLVDANHDNRITYQEFVDISGGSGDWKEAFDQMDTNQDGYITFKEFSTEDVIDNQVRGIMSFAKELMTSFDADGDLFLSQNEFFTHTEYHHFEFISSRVVKSPDKNIKLKGFSAGDINNDGRLTQYEIEGVLGYGIALGYDTKYSNVMPGDNRSNKKASTNPFVTFTGR